MRFRTRKREVRHGAIAVLVAILMIPLMAIVALAIDYGYLLKIRTDLQRAADAAALAAVQQLIPDSAGYQDVGHARDAVGRYSQMNLTSSFQVLDADIQVGRFDPSRIYKDILLLPSGVLDTVRVRVRYDETANARVPLYFARVIGIHDAAVSATATAILQKASSLRAGADILPFAVPRSAWKNMYLGDLLNIYDDGHLTDQHGQKIPGNWGTVDIGADGNSAADLEDQIRHGLRQKDLDALYAAHRISSPAKIDADEQFWANADAGLSAGMKSAVRAIQGEARLVPIYQRLQVGPGNNLEYQIVGWGAVTVVDSQWTGNKRTFVSVRKSFLYDGHLAPQADLSRPYGDIDGAYTSPVLVE